MNEQLATELLQLISDVPGILEVLPPRHVLAPTHLANIVRPQGTVGIVEHHGQLRLIIRVATSEHIATPTILREVAEVVERHLSAQRGPVRTATMELQSCLVGPQ